MVGAQFYGFVVDRHAKPTFSVRAKPQQLPLHAVRLEFVQQSRLLGGELVSHRTVCIPACLSTRGLNVASQHVSVLILSFWERRVLVSQLSCLKDVVLPEHRGQVSHNKHCLHLCLRGSAEVVMVFQVVAGYCLRPWGWLLALPLGCSCFCLAFVRAVFAAVALLAWRPTLLAWRPTLYVSARVGHIL